MYRYFVADTNTKDLSMTLRDDAGRLHVAHAPYAVPRIGDLLMGTLPGFGPHTLTDAAGGVLRVHFDLVNCGQQAALEKLHGYPAP